MADIVSNLDLHLKMNDDVLDSTSNGYHGTLVGFAGTEFTAGKFGKALQFEDTINHYVDGTTDLAYTTEDITIAYWMNLTAAGGNAYQWHFAKIDVAAPSEGYGCLWRPAANYWLYFYAGNGVFLETSRSSSSLAALVDGLYHHIAWVKTGTTMALYVDGAVQTLNTYVTHATIVNKAANWLVGVNVAGGTQRCKHPMDDLRVYSRALALADITRLQRPYPKGGNNLSLNLGLKL